MRFVLLVLTLGVLLTGLVTCPDSVRRQAIEVLTPDEETAAEVDAAVRSLIAQMGAIAPDVSEETDTPA